MDFIKFAAERYSVRSYSSRPVEPEKLERIIEAAMLAPTACNNQPQRIYVLKSEAALAKIRDITDSTYDAPVVFLICEDRSRSWHSPFVPEYDSGEMDGSIVCTHMMLEAHEQGLGSCWVLLFDPARVREAFSLPENIRTLCLLPVGYPAEGAKPAKWHASSREAGDVVVEL